MKTIAVSLAVIIGTTLSIWAQDKGQPGQPNPQPQTTAAPPQVQCGKIEVKSAMQLVRDGQPVKFTATGINAAQGTQPIYSWSISGGTIVGGQGTPGIEVDTTGAGVDKQITATLMVGGLPPECPYDGSGSVRVASPAKKLDEYGTLKEEEENAKLDAFAQSISPSEVAYVIVYAGRTNPRGYGMTEVRRIRNYLTKAGLTADRIVTQDGGFREEAAHELWWVPIGAEAPRPTPTVSPRDIVYPKPTPAAPVKKPGT